jgi:MFS family permease
MAQQETPRLTGTQWLICFVAALGFAFDIYELLMLPLIVRPAIIELSGGSIQFGSPEYGYWRDMLFYLPAVCGGVFGLLGGYLTDRLGRRRVLVWSILLYAFSALAAGFATSLPLFVFFRCTTFVGVCVEFVAAVAWLAELFPNPKQRESVLGYTQAFSSFGGLMISGANYIIVTFAENFPAIYSGHAHWRYTLISGVIPALPLIIIRPFLPESPAWQKKKSEGTLKRPSFTEIFQPALRKTTLVTTAMFAFSYGAAFGAIQQLPQIVPSIPEVAAERQAVQQQAEQQSGPLAARQAGDRVAQQTVSLVQSIQEIGGLVGRFLLAFLAVRILSRRKLIRVFQIPGLILIPLIFIFPAVSNLGLLKVGIFFAGLFTVAQFSFWGNYLPRVYPTHLRGTGESFAANIGGRMIGTSAALLTTQFASIMPGGASATKLAYAAAAVAFLVYLLGLVSSFWLPEPQHQELPE